MTLKTFHKRKAFVLVSVLMMGVLLISCATAFTWFVRQQVRGVGRERVNLTARSMAQVLASSVMSALSAVSTRVNYDSPSQRWYMPYVIPIEDLGIWVVHVTPLDDKIPLGNLFLPDGNTLRGEFKNVWHDMWEKILPYNTVEDLVLDFLDRNTRPRVGSTERDDFINRSPYDMSELLILSNDIDTGILYGTGERRGLMDYCTIYSDGKINLNVAPLHVLEILPGLDAGSIAERLVQDRTENPLESMNDLQKIPGASAKTSTQLTNIAGFKSRYFQMKIESLTDEGESGTSFNIIFDRTTRKIVRWEES